MELHVWVKHTRKEIGLIDVVEYVIMDVVNLDMYA